MLKITRYTNEPHICRLVLEGKLLQPWIEELRVTCQEDASRFMNLNLDLAGISFVDLAGVAMLRELVSRGVRLTKLSPYVSELLNEERAL